MTKRPKQYEVTYTKLYYAEYAVKRVIEANSYAEAINKAREHADSQEFSVDGMERSVSEVSPVWECAPWTTESVRPL